MLDVSSPRPGSSPRRWRRFAGFGLAGLALWLGWQLWYIFGGGGNFHAVLPGRIYRGAQATPGALEALVRRYGIRTIVNLRGCCAPEAWYLGEARVAATQGINQEDLTFSATRLPSKHELRHLIEVLDRSEPPFFLHCRQGADRTGLAGAVAMLLQPDIPYAEARRQLGLRYAHLSFGQTGRLDTVFDLYERWLQATSQSHTPAALRRWVAEEYGGGWLQGRFEKVERIGELRSGQPLGYRVQVRNVGAAPWRIRPNTAAGVHVACRLTDDKGCDLYEGRGGLFEAEVGPGQLYEAMLVLPLPKPGRYRLLLDLIEEGHAWFYAVGSEPWEEELVVHG